MEYFWSARSQSLNLVNAKSFYQAMVRGNQRPISSWVITKMSITEVKYFQEHLSRRDIGSCSTGLLFFRDFGRCVFEQCCHSNAGVAPFGAEDYEK